MDETTMHRKTHEHNRSDGARPGRDLYSKEYGSGGRPVLFLHGLAGSGRFWRKVAKEIASERQVVVPDLLGFGRSPWPDVAYTLNDHLAALDRLLEDRGLLSGTFDIVGHSMGAVLGAELAARHRELVKHVVLVSLPYFKSEPDASSWVIGLGRLARMTLEGGWKGRIACRVMCSLRPLLKLTAPRFAPYLPGAIVQDFFQHNFTSVSGSLNNVIVRHRLDPALGALRQTSVTLVHGDADLTAPLTNVVDLANAFPSWRIEVVPEGNHLLPIEIPAVLVQSIREACAVEQPSVQRVAKTTTSADVAARSSSWHALVAIQTPNHQPHLSGEYWKVEGG